MKKKHAFLWFLFGLGSQLQLFGTSLCFTEIFVYVAGLILFNSEYPQMRRNGVAPFFWLTIAVMINAAASCLYNHSPMFAVTRGMAVVCLLPCAVVVSHWMLRKDPASFKWSIVGTGISSFLSTFYFQQAVMVTSVAGGVRDANTASEIMKGPLWLVGQVGTLLTVFPKGWYLQFPTWLSAGLPVGLATFALFTSVSGRGTAVRSMCSAALILLGGKKPSRIWRNVCCNFWMMCIVGLVTVFAFKFFYQTAATSGWLGEKAMQKYEKQTQGNSSIGQLILGGRSESFIGFFAALDRPIIGWGPWATDTHDYSIEFVQKFGTREEVLATQRAMDKATAPKLLSCHAYISEFWCWYGICGLLLWIYVMFVLVRYLRQDCYAVPQWFMWLAASVPAYFWNIFFNPFSARVPAMMFVVAVLYVRAVRKGVQPLPFDMQMEIQAVESGW